MADQMTHREQREIVDEGARTRTAEVDTHRMEISPGRWILGLVGIVLGVVGVVVVVRAGIDSSLETPVVDVLGMGYSAIVGLIALGAGVLLVLSAASESTRPLGSFIGALLLVAGVVGVAMSDDARGDLGLTTEAGWFIAICGLVALLAGLFGYRVRTTRRTQDV
jgi:drug/metabolite transporter (DMT)-like permease